MNLAFRKILVCLIAVFALSAVVASAASADAGYEIQNAKKEAPQKVKFTSTSGEGRLSIPKAATTVVCKKDKDVGEFVAGSKTKLQKIVVTFEECKVEAKEKVCPIANLVTASLKGEITEAEAKEVGALLLEPEVAANGFVTIPETECNVETKVTGKIAGEIPPQAKGLKQKVNFNVVSGKQDIKEVETNADVVVKTKLEAFGFEATEETKDENTFEEELELVEGV